MRIAIVGAGISGLTCAHLLHRDHHVVVFEAAETAGGHAHTVDVETGGGVHAIDTGFIVFNDRNYPGFQRLLAELNVPTQPSTMSFGVSDGRGFEYNGASPDGLFARRRHLISPAFTGWSRTSCASTGAPACCWHPTPIHRSASGWPRTDTASCSSSG